LLVDAVDIPFSVKEAFRLGFLGYVLNFVGLGGVGGDLFKGYILIQNNPGKRLEAFSTIFMDRLIGLYALFTVAALASLSLDFSALDPMIRTLCWILYVCTAGGLIGIGLIYTPLVTSTALNNWLTRMPWVGQLLGRALAAVRMYRARTSHMGLIALQSLAVHFMFSVAAYLLAAAMFTQHPTLPEMLIVTPLAMVVASIPLSPGGMGTLELAIAGLYVAVPAEEMSQASGITVALGFRALTIGMATIGAVFYWTNRADINRQMQDAKAHEEELFEASDQPDQPVVS